MAPVVPGQRGLRACDEGGSRAAVRGVEGGGHALGFRGVHQAEGRLSGLQGFMAGVPGQVGHTGLSCHNLLINIRPFCMWSSH